jgi:multicomponent Na+:H+ antiporter subunit B
VTRRRIRLAVFFVFALGFAAFLFWGIAGLPHFGHYQGPYGDIINNQAYKQRHTTNAVAAIVFDYRGLDTMGEELILFTSVVGVALLLRHVREEELTPPQDAVESEGIRLLGILAVGPVVVLGLFVVAFGTLTPGGGFQGGVVLASGALLIWLAGSYRAWHSLTPVPLVDFAEGIGAGAYIAIGLAGLGVSSAFLGNFIELGPKGKLDSGGTIPFLNWAAGIEVAAAMTLLISEFLKQYVAPMQREREQEERA